MKLYQFQIKKTVASLVILATVFLIVTAFQNCNEVRISGHQGSSTDLLSGAVIAKCHTFGVLK